MLMKILRNPICKYDEEALSNPEIQTNNARVGMTPYGKLRYVIQRYLSASYAVCILAVRSNCKKERLRCSLSICWVFFGSWCYDAIQISSTSQKRDSCPQNECSIMRVAEIIIAQRKDAASVII